MFNNKKDPLVDAVKKIMEQNEKEREALKIVNEAFGVHSKKALPHELHGKYDAMLEEAKKCMYEEGNDKEQKLTKKQIENIASEAGNPKEIEAVDFKKLRKKKRKKLEEKAPPGEKYERMVKHIKKGYAKGGLTKKEKGIAYATAWKEKDKENMDESFDALNEEIRNNLLEKLNSVYETYGEQAAQYAYDTLSEEERGILGEDIGDAWNWVKGKVSDAGTKAYNWATNRPVTGQAQELDAPSSIKAVDTTGYKEPAWNPTGKTVTKPYKPGVTNPGALSSELVAPKGPPKPVTSADRTKLTTDTGRKLDVGGGFGDEKQLSTAAQTAAFNKPVSYKSSALPPTPKAAPERGFLNRAVDNVLGLGKSEANVKAAEPKTNPSVNVAPAAAPAGGSTWQPTDKEGKPITGGGSTAAAPAAASEPSSPAARTPTPSTSAASSTTSSLGQELRRVGGNAPATSDTAGGRAKIAALDKAKPMRNWRDDAFNAGGGA